MILQNLLKMPIEELPIPLVYFSLCVNTEEKLPSRFLAFLEFAVSYFPKRKYNSIGFNNTSCNLQYIPIYDIELVFQ